MKWSLGLWATSKLVDSDSCNISLSQRSLECKIEWRIVDSDQGSHTEAIVLHFGTNRFIHPRTLSQHTILKLLRICFPWPSRDPVFQQNLAVLEVYLPPGPRMKFRDQLGLAISQLHPIDRSTVSPRSFPGWLWHHLSQSLVIFLVRVLNFLLELPDNGRIKATKDKNLPQILHQLCQPDIWWISGRWLRYSPHMTGWISRYLMNKST